MVAVTACRITTPKLTNTSRSCVTHLTFWCQCIFSLREKAFGASSFTAENRLTYAINSPLLNITCATIQTGFTIICRRTSHSITLRKKSQNNFCMLDFSKTCKHRSTFWQQFSKKTTMDMPKKNVSSYDEPVPERLREKFYYDFPLLIKIYQFVKTRYRDPINDLNLDLEAFKTKTCKGIMLPKAFPVR